MNKYILSIAFLLANGVAAAAGAGACATNREVKLHLKVDVTLEHAQKLINLIDQKGPEAVNLYVKWLDDMKAKGYIRSYHVNTYSCDKTGGTTIQYSFDADVSVNPSASKECKFWLETLIKNKSNLKMVHKAIKQEFDYSSRSRAADITQWLNEIKKGIKSAILLGQYSYSAQPDPKNPVCIALSGGNKLGTYVHDEYGCHVKINEFKCEMVK